MKNGITKEQSKMLQGLSILMMLYHHLFSTPEALGIKYYSLLKIGAYNIELHTAWFFKICVGIYAFLTGYGMCKSLSVNTSLPKNDTTFINTLTNNYKRILIHLSNFYIQYLLVFLIFVPIGFIFYNKPFVLSEFILNLIGIKATYNGAWWYVLFYYKIMMILPIIDAFFRIYKDKKSVIFYILIYSFIIISILSIRMINIGAFDTLVNFFQPAFFLCFLMGYIISKFKLYEMCIKLFTERIMLWLGIIGFFLVVAARVKIAKDASSAGLDFIFVPVFVFGFSCIMKLAPKLSPIFTYFGKYSTYMWLTHVFFYDHYAKKLVMFSHFSTLIYLTLIVLSLISAIILSYIEKYLKAFVKNGHIFKLSKM